MSAAPFFDFSSLIRNWISELRIRTAHRTNVIKLKFQLHRQYPSPTSTLDLYFSSMIPFISMLWLRDSISLSICFNGMRGRTHWILLSSKVYFGHSWLYIWYNSAYIYFRRWYRTRPITPLLRWGEPSLHLTHKSLFDLPTTKVCDLPFHALFWCPRSLPCGSCTPELYDELSISSMENYGYYLHWYWRTILLTSNPLLVQWIHLHSPF